MEKVKFIKLHESENNTVVILAAKKIIYASRSDKETTIGYIDGEDMSSELVVNETPEKISTLVDFKMIKLHNYDDNTVIMLNINYIKYICRNDGADGTTVEIFDSEFTVNEMPEKIFNILQKEEQDKLQ